MSPSEAAVAAQACLELLVEGSTARETAIFRELGRVPGIHLRKPAVGSGPPAFERGEVSEDHGGVFSAGEGPEISAAPYVFMDACPLYSVTTETSGAKLIATFTAVTSYPAEVYPEPLSLTPLQLATHRVLLPRSLNAIDWCVHELWYLTREVLGDDADLVEFEGDIRELSFEELSQ